MYTEITKCRLTGSSHLETVLDLGRQSLTGVFPATVDENVPAGPVELVVCPDGGLVQLRQSYSLSQMYGENYGYRSGLNKSMVRHLEQTVATLTDRVQLNAGDIVLDIGSNDGTLLGAYQDRGLRRIGIDPSAEKFRHFYQPGIQLVVDFFSARNFERVFPGEKAALVTSIAMFYDLEDPMDFVQQVANVLAPNGIWHFEQSYLPLMLERTAYDTVCHEHLEYYALRQIKWMTDRAGLKIIDVELNDVNGGSFAITVSPRGAAYPEATAKVDALLAREHSIGLHTMAPYEAFRSEVFRHRDELVALVARLKAEGRTIAGLGASTKGNVLLQFCGLDANSIAFISDVNPDKFGCFTPGSRIPIIAEREAEARRPDYMLVLPWHFRDNLVERERDYLARGGRLIFPLPQIEVVAAEGVLT